MRNCVGELKATKNFYNEMAVFREMLMLLKANYMQNTEFYLTKLQASVTWGVVVMASRFRIERLQVQLPAIALSGNNSKQVAHAHVPLSPSGKIWYQHMVVMSSGWKVNNGRGGK